MLIANSPGGARAHLFVLPGSHYDDPEFSWKWAAAPAGIGFAGSGLGSHAGNLFAGESRTFLHEGYLFEFQFDNSRRHFAFSDAALKDGVDDNDDKFDEGESKSLTVLVSCLVHLVAEKARNEGKETRGTCRLTQIRQQRRGVCRCRTGRYRRRGKCECGAGRRRRRFWPAGVLRRAGACLLSKR